jgi:adenosine deaminase
MIHSDLPLVELHRHLDGSVRLATILELGQQYHLPLPADSLTGLRPFVQVTEPQPGVMAFIEKFHWMTAVMVNADAIYRIAYENVIDLRQEGIAYAELRFSPLFMAEAHQLDPLLVIDAVIAGVQAAANESGVQVNLIGILSRTYGVDKAWAELNAILARKAAFCGVDLAGDEYHFPGDLFIPHFKAVRDAGLHVTIHAGEARGPESIWQAIRGLGAERIGHAVSAPQDPALMAYMAENQIAVEVNLTSNVQTSTVPSYREHPLKQFLAAGIPVSLNTDDPGISAIDLPYEYNLAAPAAGCSPADTRKIQSDAVQSAFIDENLRERLFACH